MAKLTCIRPRVATVDTRRALPPPKTADRHYSSPEHRAWRAEVVRRAGHRCQGLIGGLPCGRTGTRLFADHIVELRDGGDPLDPRNGQALRGSCHSGKTATMRRIRHTGIPS